MRRIIRILAALSQRQISTGNSAMTTLTSPPLAALLTQLFADAEASDAQLKKDMSDQLPEEIARRATSSDYLAFYRRAKDYHLAVSPETGRLLYMVARSRRARDRRVRHLVRDLDAPSRRGAQGQRRRAPDRLGLRTIKSGAGTRQSQRSRFA